MTDNEDKPEKGKGLMRNISVSAPNMRQANFRIHGTAPLMIARFSEKTKNEMLAKHLAGSTSRKNRKHEARVIEDDFNEARHISRDGWDGIHAGAFRAAMISACRLVGFKMTLAKLALFIMEDGYDQTDGTPLVRIIGPEPTLSKMPVRNATGVPDIRVRPIWHEWGALVRIYYDGDIFTEQDVTNLMMRVGMQVGLCEGRPDSRASAGIGFGTFRLQRADEAEPAPITRRSRRAA